MQDRISILRNAISTIAKSLAEQDVQIQQRGLAAFVTHDPKTGKPKVINLPYIPDTASDDFISAIHGYLDSKVSNVLFSNHNHAFVAKVTERKSVVSFFEVLEELRTEKLMFERYKGSSAYNNQLSKMIVDSANEEINTISSSGGDLSEAIGKNIPLVIKALGGNFEYKEFIEKNRTAFGPIVDMLAPLQDKINAMQTTSDAIELAKKMANILENAEEPTDDYRDDEDKSENEKTDEKSNEDDSGKSEESNNSEEDQQDSDDEDKSEGDSNDESDSQDGKSSDSHNKENTDSNPVESSSELPKGIDGSVINAFKSAKDLSSALIKKQYKDITEDKDSYLVYTTDFDKVENVEICKDADVFVGRVCKLDDAVGIMAKDIERALTAKDKVIWEHGLSRGRLNNSSLSKLVVSNDKRIFKKKHEAEAKNVAVSIVVDYSGSMHNDNKILTAVQSAYALAKVLDRLNICFEVSFFSTRTDVKFEKTGDLKIFARIDPLLTLIAKQYHEKMTYKTKQKLATLFVKRGMMMNNVDGESVEQAYKRLLGQRANKKIMIVLSDGSPWAEGSSSKQSKHLKNVVKNIESSDVKIVGIGIKTNSVKEYYPNNVVINDVKELQQGVMKELGKILLS